MIIRFKKWKLQEWWDCKKKLWRYQKWNELKCKCVSSKECNDGLKNWKVQKNEMIKLKKWKWVQKCETM